MHNHRRDRSAARRRALTDSASAALALAGLTFSVPSVAAATMTAQPAPEQVNPEIIVIAPRIFSDLRPDRDLDETDIAGYGAGTVDELLAELRAELGEDGELPVLIVNGERVNSLDDIAALPIETLRRVQILPRGSAVRVGGRSGQRVVSLTLNRQARSATVTATNRLSTEGDWHSGRGGAIATYIRGPTRANLALRMRDDTALLESDRGIVQPVPSLPFAVSGNVVGFPDSAGEIDPSLSAIAGLPVTVSPIPANGSPELADFAQHANQPATTDLGQFRTLRPSSRSYDVNGTVATRLAPWLSTTATVRLTRNLSRAMRGLPSALFLLPADQPFSPFSTDVGLAYYAKEPLDSRNRLDGGEANLTLNGRFGSWVANVNLRHNRTREVNRTERDQGSGPISIDADVDPFGTDLTALVSVRTDRTTSRTTTNSFQGIVMGPLVNVPAGQVQFSGDVRLVGHRLRSGSTVAAGAGQRRLDRSEQAFRGAVEVPLTSSASDFLPEMGELTATGEWGWVDATDRGILRQRSIGLTWEPRPILRLRGAIEHTGRPAPIASLGNPAIFTSDVRMFDPLTGATVDVVQITGGNPDLVGESVRVQRLAGTIRPVRRFGLQLNAEYTDTDVRNFLSSLPEASAQVMFAFPDRFIRDSNGVLTTVDLRPVNFDSHRQKRLRYGISANVPLAGGAQVRGGPSEEGEEAGEDREDAPPVISRRSGRGTRLRLAASHGVVLSDEILIRPGLDPINILEGGAIGIASGRVRHEFNGSANLTANGLGVRFGAALRGGSRLERRIEGVVDTLRFSPLLTFNLRAFANADKLFPDLPLAKGTRISLNAVNLTNDRQRVRDSAGITPLQYQPGYRDPLGRTVELELRRVF